MTSPSVSDADRAVLRKTVRDFLATGTPDWHRMAAELGLQGLGLPEAVGGAGYGPLELAVVHEELGRVLDPSPFFATVALAAPALVAAGDTEFLPGIARGETIAALALPPGGLPGPGVPGPRAIQPAPGTAAESAQVRATEAADGWRLTGCCERVLAGAEATLVLVPATTSSGLALFAVVGDDLPSTRTGDGIPPPVVAHPLTVLDGTRPQARIELTDAPARLVATDAPGLLEHACMHAAVMLAAELVGAAQAALDMAVAYAKTRVQFGRVIGSFQAVKHQLVDLAISVELARSVADEAAHAAAEEAAHTAAEKAAHTAADKTADSAANEAAGATANVAAGAGAGGQRRLPMLAAIAQAYCSEALVTVAEENIQIHGGIGVTWEHPAHRYFRRATWAESFLGSPAEHRRRIAAALEQST